MRRPLAAGMAVSCARARARAHTHTHTPVTTGARRWHGQGEPGPSATVVRLSSQPAHAAGPYTVPWPGAAARVHSLASVCVVGQKGWWPGRRLRTGGSVRGKGAACRMWSGPKLVVCVAAKTVCCRFSGCDACSERKIVSSTRGFEGTKEG